LGKFTLSGQHDHSEAGSQILGGGFSIPGSTSDDNSFSGGLSGVTPIGSTYSLQGNTRDQYGHNFATDTNGNIFSRPFENSGASASLSVTQPLLKNLWIDNNRLVIHISKNRLKYSEVVLKGQIMQTITLLEQAYYELIYNRENLNVQQKAVELAERLVMENRKRLEVGALAPLDLQSAEAQAASTRAAVIRAAHAGTASGLNDVLLAAAAFAALGAIVAFSMGAGSVKRSPRSGVRDELPGEPDPVPREARTETVDAISSGTS
jgi:hypothetical protein